MKKIGLLCLCLASLSLVGCFHIPDEDWLPSRNKVNTGGTQNNDIEKALNSFMKGIDMVSSQRNDMKSEEITSEGSDENVIENGDDGTADNESTYGETGDILNE